MAIKAIIIDDERLARNELKKLLQDHDDIEVIEEAANVDDGAATTTWAPLRVALRSNRHA